MTVEAPDRPPGDASTRDIRSLRQSSWLFVGPIAITALSCRRRRCAQSGDQPQDVAEPLSRHRDLGHLEHDLAPVADNLDADPDQLFPIAEVVGERMELKTDGVGGERADDLVFRPNHMIHPTRRRRMGRAAQTRRNECRRWVSLKGRARNPWLSGSARCVLRDDRFRGLLRMRNSSMPSKPHPHPEKRSKSPLQGRTGGASRRTQARYAALRLYSCPASQLNPS